jgi:hypothetical protein
MGDDGVEIEDLDFCQKTSDILEIEDYVSRYFILNGISAAIHFGWPAQLLADSNVKSIARVGFSPVSSSEAIEEIDPYPDGKSSVEEIPEHLSAAVTSDDFDVTVLVGIIAMSEEDLEQATEDLHSKADEIGVSLTVLQHQLKEAFRTLVTTSWEIESPIRMPKEGVAASTAAMDTRDADDNQVNEEPKREEE